MKMIYAILALIALAGCADTKQSDNNDNYYSTKVDTSYSAVDRTKIEGVRRMIYNKAITSSFSGKSERIVSLTNSTKENENSFMIWECDDDLADASSLHFKNEDELLDFFSKVDALNVGEELEERKKTKHYFIAKGEENIEIKVWKEISAWGKMAKLSSEEYLGIKDAYTKFSNENK